MGTSCERNSSYSFVPIVLKLCICFLHGMKICMWFRYNCQNIFCHFLPPLIYRQLVPLVSATPLTVLNRIIWNFAYVFFMVWGCARGLDIIVRSFILSLFPHCELSHFSPFIYKQLVPLVSATPLTVLYRLLWNCACVFFMVWGCACDLDFYPQYINSGTSWAKILIHFFTNLF